MDSLNRIKGKEIGGRVGGRVGIKGRVEIGGCCQGRRVDRVTEDAEIKACHKSMLVLERKAVLEAQIDPKKSLFIAIDQIV